MELVAVVTDQVKYTLNINAMKKVLFILFTAFMVTNLYAQVGNNCNFNNSKGEVRNGRIYEVTRTTDNENKSEKTNSWGAQGSVNIKSVVNTGGNYSNSTSSSSSNSNTTTRRGYECCDDNICTSDYKEGKSTYAEDKKGKYLKPKK